MSVFNKRLYCRTLSRLKLSGTIFFVLCLVISYVPIINRIAAEDSMSFSSINQYVVAPPLYGFVFIGSVVLTMSAFAYMNSRSASDYYHSLPNTRVCTLLSMMSAVLTWGIGTIVAVCGLCGLGYAVTGSEIDTAGVFLAMGYYSMVALQIVGCTLIGMSVTGTFFSGIITTGLVAFLPRALITFFQLTILSVAGIIPPNSINSIFDMGNNLSVSFLAPFMTGGTNRAFMENPTAYIYTAVLIILYFAFGSYLFIRRKSETAGKAAPGKITNAVYRCAITLPVLLIFYYILVTGFTNGGMRSQFIALLIIMICAAAVYFIYEAIVSRKFKTLVKSIPVFIVLVAVTGVMTFAARNIGIGIMKYVPAEADIVNIQVDTGRSYTYNEHLKSMVKISDEEVRKIALQSLVDTIKTRESSDYHYYGGWSERTIRFNLKDGSEAERMVMMPEAEYQRMNLLLGKNEEYLKAAQAMPAPSEIIEYTLFPTGAEKGQTMEVYEALLEDIKNNSQIVPTLNYTEGNEGPNIYIQTMMDGEYYYQTYYLTNDTPLALKKFMEVTKENSKLDEGIQKAGNIINGGSGSVSLSVSANNEYKQSDDNATAYETSNNYINVYYDSAMEGVSLKDMKDAVAIIEKAMGREVSDIYRVSSVDFWTPDADSSGSYRGVVLLTDEELKQLTDISESQKER